MKCNNFFFWKLKEMWCQAIERFPFVWKNRSFWWDNKWNSPSHWKFFGKKGIASDVVLFSHCYRNNRNITEPFASSHSHTMLLGEMRGSFPKIASGRNRSIWFHNGTTVFSIRTVPFGGKFPPVFPYKWKALIVIVAFIFSLRRV